MSTIFKTLRNVLQGVYTASFSYIKPGVPHRLTLDREPEIILRTVYGIINKIYEAASLGIKLHKGVIGYPDLGIGQLLSSALKEAYISIGKPPLIDVIIYTTILSTALSYVIDEGKESISDVKYVSDRIIQSSRDVDLINFIDGLRAVGHGDIVEDLEVKGFTVKYIELEGLNLSDGLRALIDKIPQLEVMIPGNDKVIDIAKTIIKEYERCRDINNAVVKAYIELIMENGTLPDNIKRLLKESINQGLALTGKGQRILFNIDKELRKNKLLYMKYFYMLIPAVIISSIKIPI